MEGIVGECVVVGGLKDAIGPCGVTFPNGAVEALAQCLEDLLRHSEKLAGYRAHAASHLARHKKEEVARAYLKVMEQAFLKHRRGPN